jgi:muramidase (phage lysozyme)
MTKTESKPDVLENLVGSWLVRSLILLSIVMMIGHLQGKRVSFWTGDSGPKRGADVPLVMNGGDPHIRALMRTISASESNVKNPYGVLYSGDYTQDLNQHPDRCITILAGPNRGNCTTAAGRYQFITTTWINQSKKYHPTPSGFLFWNRYSFEPEFQDRVVYRWLSDPSAWGADLKQLLKNGQVKTVFQILSPTWTSLGYGIETNSMSAELPKIYQRMLEEELKKTSQR